MKFICSKCGAKYFHNSMFPKLQPFYCRFCGGQMIKGGKMTVEEFKEHYISDME